MPRRKNDKFVHLRLCKDTQAALDDIAEQIRSDPFANALLRVKGSQRIPNTRVILFAIGMARARKVRAA